MTLSDVRQAITALREISNRLGEYHKYGPVLDDAVAALDGERAFACYAKLGNTAANLLKATKDVRVRAALSSLAFHAYSFCVDHSAGQADFTPSRADAETIAAALGGPLGPGEALRVVRESLDASADPEPETPDEEPLDDEHANADTKTPEGATAAGAPPGYFAEAVSLPLAQRLSERLLEWRTAAGEPPQRATLAGFEARLHHLIDIGEEDRQFGTFAIVEEDLSALRNELTQLSIPERPTDILARIQVCRNLAAVEFRMADVSLFAASRRSWLTAAFWNDALIELWPTNEEQFVHDVLGYLSVIHAEHRYAAHADDVLLLLRVAHLICRIASSEELVPTTFYQKFGRIETWVRYAVGTVLAISGPGRVPPSRINNDPRLVDKDGKECDRDKFAAVLLPKWRAPEEREAAAAIVLELAAWSLPGAERLILSTLRDAEAEREVWSQALADVVARASRVKVLRPNPWAKPVPSKIITADRHALAVLASDVIHRTFPSLESAISLNGTAFRGRRVPTFLCSADFGPLGIFKADARDRITREAANFTRYAQRLHPRYRASRCDRSVAAISEPDDRIEFVGGLLTSYVFTAREAPRSLTDWFQESETSVVLELANELFRYALKPWYQHATPGALDILGEYEVFSRSGLAKLENGLIVRDDLAVGPRDNKALSWLGQLVGWVTEGKAPTDPVIEEHAAALQTSESLRAVTHGDLHLDNVMVLGKPGAEYPCLIDFETTGEGHILRDCGRFVGAVLFRTYDWDGSEVTQLRSAMSRGLISGLTEFVPDRTVDSPRVQKAVEVINAAWQSYVYYWRGDARPSAIECVATMVCSFLPFARYPDTRQRSAELSLRLAEDCVGTVWK